MDIADFQGQLVRVTYSKRTMSGKRIEAYAIGRVEIVDGKPFLVSKVANTSLDGRIILRIDVLNLQTA